MRKKEACKWLLFGGLLFGGILFLIPVILTIIGSFLLKGELSLQGYLILFRECFPFYRMFWNSVMYSVCITIGTIVIAIPVAYAFKYARFRGKNMLYVIYIILMLMPLQVMVLPNYIGLRDMKLLNTPFAIILPLLFSPLAVVGLLVFSETWNMVEQPLLYLDEDKWRNLSLLFSEADQYQAEVILPAAVLFMVPMLLWYLLFRDELQKGLKL